VDAVGEGFIGGDESHSNANGGHRLNHAGQSTVFGAAHPEPQPHVGAGGQVDRDPEGDETASFAYVADFAAKELAGVDGDAFRKSRAADSDAAAAICVGRASRLVVL